MTEAPVAEVEVTREHREAAVIALREHGPGCSSWIEDGKPRHDVFFHWRLPELAQAIAAAEARGRAQACQRDPLRIAELEADFSRMAELGNKARSLETAERDELNALLKKAAALGLKG